jgi:glycosyltransferase involved in cell wall biosynthesis
MPFDIMMPFYGRFDHLKLAVESVLAQSNDDWRLVIVDDVNPDEEPGRWAAAIADPRVTYLRNEQNLGVSRNYRKCVELMTSDFGMLMGCDDVLLPGFVERVHALTARFPEASIIQPGVRVIDADGKGIRPLADRVKALYRPHGRNPRTYEGEQLATSLLRGNWTYFPSLVWRAEVIREIGFRLDLNVVQDLAMLLEIAKRGGSLVLDDEVVFAYRRHSTSVSSVTGPDGSKFRQERTVFYEAAADLSALGWTRGARVARRYLSSRLNAMTELPGAIRAADPNGRRVLASHILGRAYPADRD